MKTIFLALLICLCATLCLAQRKKSNEQTRPNLSGTWILSPSESKVPGFNIALANDSVTEIIYREPELRIITKAKEDKGDTSISELVYYTDNRGETNPSGAKTDTSKTKWEGRKLVSKFKDEGKKTEWELSPDGNKLTRTTIIKNSVTIRILGEERTTTNKSEIRLVYTRT